MTKKIIERMNTFSSIEWWSGFDSNELNSITAMKKQKKTNETICWPFYCA